MKTCIVSLSWLDETDAPTRPDKATRLERNLKYLRYYKPLLPLLGADSIHLYDNASSLENLKALVDQSGMTLGQDLFITRFANFMPRKSDWDYPYCWRLLRQSCIDLPEMGYNKFLFIDSDFFILKQKMIDWINQTNTGWVSIEDKGNRFPESAFSIVNQDSFDLYRTEAMKPIGPRKSQPMELSLPYTYVEKKFKGGRYGDKPIPDLQDATMDYYAQCVVATEVKFEDIKMINSFANEFQPNFINDHNQRWPAFKCIAGHLFDKNKKINILETGCLRLLGNWAGDGQSTLLWDWIVKQTGGFGFSVDISEDNCKVARSVCNNLSVVQADSIPFLRGFDQARELDLLFLDSFDWATGAQHISSCFHHLGELAAIWDKLSSGCLIAVDDCHSDTQGKHIGVKKFLEEVVGIQPLYKGYITVWVKP